MVAKPLGILPGPIRKIAAVLPAIGILLGEAGITNSQELQEVEDTNAGVTSEISEPDPAPSTFQGLFILGQRA